MRWDFEDGSAFESAYSVMDYSSDLVDTVTAINAVVSNAKEIHLNPREVYECMHRKAAAEMIATDRAKSAFVSSAISRAKSMGDGLLLEFDFEGRKFRIVAFQRSLSLLRQVDCENERIELKLAGQLARLVNGTVKSYFTKIGQ